jgi:hypothetical protein
LLVGEVDDLLVLVGADQPAHALQLAKADGAEVGDAVPGDAFGTQVDQVFVARAADAMPGPLVGAQNTCEWANH